MAACALVAALVAALLAARDFSDFRVLLLASALLGGMIFPLYALSIAMINDFMRPEKIVAAAGTIVLISGVGFTLGPFLVSLGMERFGPVAFFWFLSAVYLMLAALGVYRVASHHYVPTEEKHEYSIYAPAQVGNMLQADTVQNRELAADTAAETDADG